MNNEWALVLGGAECVWADVAAWEKIYGRQWDGITICVNDIGCHWPRPFQHWVTLHPTKLKRWFERRQKYHKYFHSFITWGPKRRHPGDPMYCDIELLPWGGGSSGMFAAQVARDMRCKKVILCGIPMTQTAHFIESEENHARVWMQSNGHWRAWQRHKNLFTGWTRSMSGRTRELFGPPTVDWLYQNEEKNRLIST